MVQIADRDNLLLAYYKAKKGKSTRKEVLDYGRQIDRRLRQLQEALLNESVHVGDYHYFTIYDPKERQICAASFAERVLHHAIMNVCHPYFEQYQLAESYATRPGKGTFRAVDRAAGFQRQYPYYLKMDIRKYFDSIDHSVLLGQLHRRFKDAALLRLFERIIGTYHTQSGKGVPIGNLTSQYFANHYMAFTDRFVKEELRMSAYVRYMDDFVIWHQDLAVLQQVLQQMEGFLSERLALSLKTGYTNKTAHGLPFLGFRLFPYKRLLSRRSKVRFAQKARALQSGWDAGKISDAEMQQRLSAMTAFAQKAYSRQYRQCHNPVYI
jgi:RNA-directed DNA polymerase